MKKILTVLGIIMALLTGGLVACDTTMATEGALTSDSSFEVHYIDVGQADSALVLCDGKAMLIDGGNTADSSLIYSYLKRQGISHLDTIICTHPHEDHAGGLAGALHAATVGVAMAPVAEYDNDCFHDFLKYLDQQGVSVTVPSAGDRFMLGSAEVTIVGPRKTADDVNNMSMIAHVVYGATSFLFTGDAERDEENDILASGAVLKSTVLKVGHHGAAAATTYPFLREVAPEYAVISVGAGNSYGHPTEAVLSRLEDAGVKIYRTDLEGTIVCRSDGSQVSFSVKKEATEAAIESAGIAVPVETTAVSAASMEYVLNTNSKKFHKPSCSSVSDMKEKNKKVFDGTRDEAIAQGYVPCKKCNP